MPRSISIEEIQRIHGGLIAASAGAAALTGAVSPWGILSGGLLMGVNVWLWRQLLHHLLAPHERRRPGWVIALGLAKQFLVLALVGALFWRVEIDAAAFAIGVSLLLVASVTAAVWPQVRAA